MLRKKVTAILSDKNQQHKVKNLLRVVTIIGFFWILSFPYIGDNIFTSENALDSKQQEPYFEDQVKSITTIFKSLQY